MSAVNPQQAKITAQTFLDMGMWLTHPEQCSQQQLNNLLDEDARLPLISLVNTYWLGGALHNSLKDSNVWQALDQELQDYLAELEQFYNQRNQGIKEEAIYACQLLTNANIPVVMLKGGASLFNGVFNPISNRFMTDIDLLVPEELQDKANQTLMSCGYAQNIEEHDHAAVGHHHAPALFREGGHCCVELHRWVLMKSASDTLSTEEVWQNAKPLALTSTLTILQMEPTQQIVLSVAHSELSHKGYEDKHIDWRQLLNLQAIAKQYQNDINWQYVFEHFNRCKKAESLSALLYAANKYLKLTTAITCTDDKQAVSHVNTCIKQYVKRQSAHKRFSHLFTVIKGYGKESIKVSYGDDGHFPVFTGRIKRMKRHLSMLTKPKYLSRFIKKVFH
ncbi:nucleotidyltransferase family protein [Thalassotalea fonticola]|uniref:Nucleotidyltransferase family protein n=1 Tax=Thalassotalea fonticola TaxID=3065649 RepID=A0ABZ0GTG9_9GAMM|nr:nucleotidyltransferase family protein [Colwelliaceae bacterium S1-1]